ncbi:MAG: SPFH domain-containing protein [bacterium]
MMDKLGGSPFSIALIGVIVLVFLSVLILVVKQYKRCPSNRILVIYGKVAGEQAAKCLHGGGRFIWPLIQDYTFLTLEPMTIEIELTGALSAKNIRVNVPSTVTVGISTEPAIMNNAAERLLSLNDSDIRTQAQDIILGQMRLVIATMEIEEINQNRDVFLQKVNANVESELNKIGLKVINVNVRDITDESGYINAIGQKAAAEAINQANVEVAEAEKSGEIGRAMAVRDKDVNVAKLRAESAMGQKEAEKNQRIQVAAYETEGVTGEKDAEKNQRIKIAEYEAQGVAGEADARRQQEVAVAEQWAKAEQGKKAAEKEQRVVVAGLEAEAVDGENKSKAQIADYNAELARRQAEAKRIGEVSLANATRDVLMAEKQQEVARLEKVQIAQIEIQKKQVEIDAEAEAEKRRRIARGEADAILARYQAEATGIQQVLQAKALGYADLMTACGDKKYLAPTLLMVEKIDSIVAEQVKAIQNLKIDKITVWDSGGANGEGGSTANFLKGLIGSLPPMHELAHQAGIELPGFLGTVADTAGSGSGGSGASPKPVATRAAPSSSAPPKPAPPPTPKV